MAKPLKWKNESVRENRIVMEIIVDCYDEDEQMLGWQTYMGDHLQFPFQAMWQSSARSKTYKPVTVVGLVEDEGDDILVDVNYAGETFTTSLLKLRQIQTEDAQARQAIGDWWYWNNEHPDSPFLEVGP